MLFKPWVGNQSVRLPGRRPTSICGATAPLFGHHALFTSLKEPLQENGDAFFESGNPTLKEMVSFKDNFTVGT